MSKSPSFFLFLGFCCSAGAGDAEDVWSACGALGDRVEFLLNNLMFGDRLEPDGLACRALGRSKVEFGTRKMMFGRRPEGNGLARVGRGAADGPALRDPGRAGLEFGTRKMILGRRGATCS